LVGEEKQNEEAGPSPFLIHSLFSYFHENDRNVWDARREGILDLTHCPILPLVVAFL